MVQRTCVAMNASFALNHNSEATTAFFPSAFYVFMLCAEVLMFSQAPHAHITEGKYFFMPSMNGIGISTFRFLSGFY